jgi:hypothetical protein
MPTRAACLAGSSWIPATRFSAITPTRCANFITPPVNSHRTNPLQKLELHGRLEPGGEAARVSG